MNDFLEITFRSIWHFFGMLLLISVVLGAPCRIINRCIRHLNIRAKGWPPEHLDADGDWKPEEEKCDS